MVFSCNSNDDILVSGLLENFDFCEFFIAYYDDGTDFDYDESKRHKALIDEAEKHGAKWVYLTQPTMRLGSGWRDVIKNNYSLTSGALCSYVYYFWDYSLNKVRIDLSRGRQIPAFFRINKDNRYSNAKLHHPAVPTNVAKHTTGLIRYDLRRLSKDVCIAKADYYENKDGTKHSALRDFSKLQVIDINPKLIKGVGKNEKKYIDRIRKKYSNY